MQFGRALWRILSTVHHADPRLGPVFFSKVDITDGFYRILVNIKKVPKLGVVVLTEAGEPQVIAFPMVLQMSWTQSTLLFTATTETVADLANQEIQASAPAGPNCVDSLNSHPA
jgi:hypothetical protein